MFKYELELVNYLNTFPSQLSLSENWSYNFEDYPSLYKNYNNTPIKIIGFSNVDHNIMVQASFTNGELGLWYLHDIRTNGKELIDIITSFNKSKRIYYKNRNGDYEQIDEFYTPYDILTFRNDMYIPLDKIEMLNNLLYEE